MPSVKRRDIPSTRSSKISSRTRPRVLAALLPVTFVVSALGCEPRDVRLADGTIDRARPPIVQRGSVRMLSDAQVAMESAGWSCEHFMSHGQEREHRVRCSAEIGTISLMDGSLKPDTVLEVRMSFDLIPGLPCEELAWRLDKRPSRSKVDGFCASHGELWSYRKSIPIPADGLPAREAVTQIVELAHAARANCRALLEFPEGPKAPKETP